MVALVLYILCFWMPCQSTILHHTPTTPALVEHHLGFTALPPRQPTPHKNSDLGSLTRRMLLRRPSPASGEAESREGLRMGELSPAAGAAPHPAHPPLPPAVTVRAANILPGHLSFGPFPEPPMAGVGPLPGDLALGLYCADSRDTHYVLQVSIQCTSS